MECSKWAQSEPSAVTTVQRSFSTRVSARPALVIVAIQNAVPIWNDFFFPLVLITSDNLKTLPQGLTVFVGEFTTDWGVLFTGLTLAALPITLLYIVLSKQFISGITQGAVK